MKRGGFWPFTSSTPPPNPQTEDESAEKIEKKSVMIENIGRAGETAVAVASTVGLAAIASSPALPVVAGLAVLVSVGLSMYAQNKKLNSLFQRTSKLVKRITNILTSMKAAEERNAFEKLDTTDVIEDVKELQRTIGKLIGPEAFKEIENTGVQLDTRNRLKYRFSRFVKKLNPYKETQRFNEQLVQLALDFSVLQGEFAIRLEKITSDLAATIAKAGETPIQVKPDISAGKEGSTIPLEENPQNPTLGGRKTRRRHYGRRHTRNRNLYVMQ